MIPRKRDSVFLCYIKTNVCELSLLTLKKQVYDKYILVYVVSILISMY